jgi:hypothetical protein
MEGILLIIINILLYLIKGNIIKINFHKENFINSYHIDNVFFSKIVTNDFSFGTPAYPITLDISTDSPYFVVKGATSPNEYKQENSTSFYFIKFGHSYEYKNIYFHSIFFNEDFILNDLIITLNSMMYWSKYPITRSYGLVGLQLYDNKFQEKNIFINQLYDKGLIKEKMFSLIYENESKGELYIGDFPHNKSKLLKRKKLKISNNTLITNGDVYGTICEEIKFSGDSDNKDNNYTVIFSNTYYSYIGSKEYNNYINKVFFKDKLINRVCWTQNIDNDRYFGYVCNKYVDTSNVPKITLYHKGLDYTFVIENREMWEYYSNIKYFLVFFSYSNQYSWILGQKFLRKYPLVIDGEKNIIGLYYTDYIFYLYLFIFLLIGAIAILAIFVYCKFFRSNKKEKKDEVSTELEYIINK